MVQQTEHFLDDLLPELEGTLEVHVAERGDEFTVETDVHQRQVILKTLDDQLSIFHVAGTRHFHEIGDPLDDSDLVIVQDLFLAMSNTAFSESLDILVRALLGRPEHQGDQVWHQVHVPFLFILALGLQDLGGFFGREHAELDEELQVVHLDIPEGTFS